MSGKKWTEEKQIASLDRDLHQSTIAHLLFLWEEFASMVEKGQ